MKPVIMDSCHMKFAQHGGVYRDTCNKEVCTDLHMPRGVYVIWNSYRTLPVNMGPVWSDNLYILPRVHMEMCRTEMFSVSHAWLCNHVSWYLYRMTGVSKDTSEVKICTLHHGCICKCVRLKYFLYQTLQYWHLSDRNEYSVPTLRARSKKNIYTPQTAKMDTGTKNFGTSACVSTLISVRRKVVEYFRSQVGLVWGNPNIYIVYRVVQMEARPRSGAHGMVSKSFCQNRGAYYKLQAAKWPPRGVRR